MNIERMKYLSLLMTVLLVAATQARGDEVRKLDGDKRTGTIQSVSPTAVTFADSVRQTAVPVNEIAAVIFTSEPRGLTEARAAYDAGRFSDVSSSLNEIKPDQVRRDDHPFVHLRQDLLRKPRRHPEGCGNASDRRGEYLPWIRQRPTHAALVEFGQIQAESLQRVGGPGRCGN